MQASDFQLRALVVVGRDVKFTEGLRRPWHGTSAQCGTTVDGIIVWDHIGCRITCDITQPNLAIATNWTAFRTV
jgi:hypothetical protein